MLFEFIVLLLGLLVLGSTVLSRIGLLCAAAKRLEFLSAFILHMIKCVLLLLFCRVGFRDKQDSATLQQNN